MPTWTCVFRAVADLFRHRCRGSCVFTAQTDCTPVICPVIPRHTVASECRTKWRSRFTTQSKLERRSPFSAERRERINISNSTARSSRSSGHLSLGLVGRLVRSISHSRANESMKRARLTRECVGAPLCRGVSLKRHGDRAPWLQETYGRCSASFLTFVL